MSAGELSEDARKKRRRYVLGRPEPDLTLHVAFGQARHDLVVDPQPAMRVWQQALAVGGQDYVARIASEKFDAKLILEPADLQTDGRLAAPEANPPPE
ncbi:MAG: hypothetical protein U1C75_05755 [Brevundimonas sp.]|nr:hypothetical protein [Brevundimonas sp.]